MMDAVSPDTISQLSERQKELLDLVSSGMTTSKAISRETGLAVGTIDNSLQNAAKNLGVVGRIEAARRYADLKEKSHTVSHVRTDSLPDGSKIEATGPASVIKQTLAVIVDYLKGPPTGGEEHSLRKDQIVLQILRVAVVGFVVVMGLVLFFLGFFRAFS